ncbi:MAG: hypothetical protein O4859_21250 [Trichodesmium sp. St18_bin1]|nr:hypothetical protein [Trichodesmium sp. St18_bin1]
MDRGKLPHPNNSIISEFSLQMQLFFLWPHLPLELRRMKKIQVFLWMWPVNFSDRYYQVLMFI